MFDYDGVIADSFDAYFGEFTAVCTELGFNRINSKEKFLRLFEGNALRQLLWAGFPMWRLKRLADHFRPRIEAATVSVKPFDGMVNLLGDLAATHHVYIVTSNTSDSIRWFLDTHGVEGIRDALGADHQPSKVKKIRGIMQRHPGAQAYYIGDTKGDMREARKAGAKAVAAAWGWHSADKLLEARPDHLCRSPEELRGMFTNRGKAACEKHIDSD
jgi:phosphoglycolate phosphatase